MAWRLSNARAINRQRSFVNNNAVRYLRLIPHWPLTYDNGQAAFSCFPVGRFAILRGMSIRRGGGKWEPMLLGIEPRNCKVCKEGLYRNKTLLSGGWSRCALCDEFVHYSCLASGKVSFLKARPRVCKTCRAAQEGAPSPSPKAATPVAVGS